MYREVESAPSGTTIGAGGFRPKSLHDLLPEWEKAATTSFRARKEGRPLGPQTGLRKLDREMGGALPAGLNIIHGQPGAGKTAFALQVAATCGCPALFVTCEMRLLELSYRLAARVTETPLGHFKSGELPPEEAMLLAIQSSKAHHFLKFGDTTQEHRSAEQLLEGAKVIRGDAEHLLIVVDSIHSYADSITQDLSEYDRLNRTLASLRGMASDLGCAVLAVAERNRSSMESGGLSAGAGSRKIEYGPETVMDLSRGKGPVGAAGEAAVTLTLDKNRHGSPGVKVNLLFHGAFQRFREQ